MLHYLQATQEADGHWPQNMWLDGTAYWSGIQMDETAFPILLVDLARREGALEPDEVDRLWPMVRRAAGFLVRNGPVTPQDRWEEDPGYSPFTLAVEIAALLAAADLADRNGERRRGRLPARDGRRLERQHRALDLRDRHRPGPRDRRGRLLRAHRAARGRRGCFAGEGLRADQEPAAGGELPARHADRQPGCPGAGALRAARRGRSADRQHRARSSIALLKVETPFGPAWHRYNDDGYGEHEDGSPFDGTGIGRAWPLLTGERAHYELAAGRRAEALRLLHALEAFANEGGLLPEQVWDAADIPETGAALRPAVRLGHAAGLGPCRVRQAAPLFARWHGVRHARPDGATLSEGADRI